HRPLVLLLLALTLLGGTGLALDIRFDRSQVENFGAGEPISRADALMNERFAGTGTLNVIVDAGEPGGLLRPDVLDRVEQLQNFFSSLPHVGKTVSIVDYLKLLDRAIKEDAGPGQLPTGENAVAQYLLVYEASGDPTDFDEEIDPTYQRLLLRGAVSSPLYSESGESVEKLERYIEQHFSGTDLQVAIAGDVNISYQWMSSLKKSHFAGVGLSLLLIFLSASILFRSAATGLLALLPVALTVLCLYACMGFAGVYLEPATAMFAAIALGVGVDFAIHLVDRLRGQDRSADEHAYFRAYAATARACLFNAAALGVGFAVLTVSELPTLIRFGALVALAAAVSYLAALLLVPALLPQPSKVVPHARRRGATALAVLAAGLLALAAQRAAAQSTADEIAAAIEGRPEGTYSQVLLDITLIHPRGGVRERQAVIHTWRTAQFKKTRITYTQPANVRDTSFLSHDYVGGAGIDERWLYTPAIGKHRRIPPSGRGKSFLGTDFSYEDIQSGLKFSLADYRFELPPAADAGSTGVRLGGVPATPAIARELRNGGFVATVDPGNWMPREITFRDPRGNPLKTIKVPVLERIDGIWSAREITAQNLKSGHQTAFKLRDIRFPTALPPELFDPRTLNRGLPGEVAP
ncbi:MAG: outer membrane lipoprotein-sorting protein, partial [Pseudomonadota bacterium]